MAYVWSSWVAMGLWASVGGKVVVELEVSVSVSISVSVSPSSKCARTAKPLSSHVKSFVRAEERRWQADHVGSGAEYD